MLKNYLKSCRQGSGHQEALRTSPDWLKEFRFDKNKTSGSACEVLEHNWLIWAWDRIYYTQIETIIAKNCGVVVARLTLTRPQLVRKLVCRQGAFVRSGKLHPCALAGKDRDFRYVRAGIVFFAKASSIYPWWEAYMTGLIRGCSVSTRRSRLPILVRFGWKIQFLRLFQWEEEVGDRYPVSGSDMGFWGADGDMGTSTRIMIGIASYLVRLQSTIVNKRYPEYTIRDFHYSPMYPIHIHR